MGLSFFKAFSWVMFPPALVLLLLLLLPLPGSVKNAVVKLTDSILFLKPHPYLPLTLFWLCLGFSFLVFLGCVESMNSARLVYENVKNTGGNTQSSLIKLLAIERNVWISGIATALWIILHRFRHLTKHCAKVEERLEVLEKKKDQ